MKKIFALALALILCLSIVACKESDDDKKGDVATTAATTEATTAVTTEKTETTAETSESATTYPEGYDPSDPTVDDIF